MAFFYLRYVQRPAPVSDRSLFLETASNGLEPNRPYGTPSLRCADGKFHSCESDVDQPTVAVYLNMVGPRHDDCSQVPSFPCAPPCWRRIAYFDSKRPEMIKTTDWGIVDSLQNEEAIAAYLEAIFEDGDANLIEAAMGDVARARATNAIRQ